MLRPLHRATMVFAILLATTAAHAEPVLNYLPPDALGFAVVKNLGGTNAKIEGFLKIFQDLSASPLPSPWPFIKASTGLGDGIDETGDALIAVLASPDGSANVRPMLLVAVSDYAKFAASAGGDASGEICRVTIAGEEVLAARRGGYAMLMNVEHRPTMETLLAADPKPSEYLAPVAEWMTGNDVVAVLTPTGVDTLTTLGQAALAAQRAAFEQQLSDPQFAPMLKQLQQSMKMYESILGFCGAEINAAAVGLSIDDASNIRLSKRLVFEKQGKLAQLSDIKPAGQSPLVGFANEPFVVAGGGPIPTQWADLMSAWARKMTEQFSAESGFQKFTDEDWKKVEESWRETMKGVHSTSTVMYAGDKDDPLISNVFGMAKVDDADAYLKASRESTEIWNELLGKSTSDLAPKMKYEFEDVEIAGKKGLLMTSDVAGAANDPNVPMVGTIMKNAFGEDGKLRIYLIAADKTTVVTGIASQEKLEAAMQKVLAGEKGLAESTDVQTTAKLLEDGAPWQLFFSPQGCVKWAARLVNEIFSQFGGGTQEIPDYPQSPPVGVSINITGGQLHAEMVWPAETSKQLAAYIKTAQDKK